MSATRTRFSDGRWHFQHGPMDIIIGAEGSAATLDAAHEAAWQRFAGVLDELVLELPLLRLPVQGQCQLQGPVARRMWQACKPYSASYITPMAAVAGAVAEELVSCYDRAGVQRAWINNGGDIALHLASWQSVRIGLYADLARLDARALRNGISSDGQFDVTSEMPVRGVATSGWRGRSFSLGIADSVTVLAGTASAADAAATMIANAVDVPDARIVRRPACELKDDSDLGEIPVTVDVPRLEPKLVQQALHAGLLRAQALQRDGLIWSAALVCQQQLVTTDLGDAQSSSLLSMNSPVIANKVKQSMTSGCMDCCASLAMTTREGVAMTMKADLALTKQHAGAVFA
jgi:ApbE superfamily uncharacterized protein (UPF0280 family)